MTALALETRPEHAIEFARLPFTGDDNPVAMCHIMLALASVLPLARETWIDFRLCGISQDTIARRERVTRSAVAWRVKKCDAAIRAYIDAKARP